MGWLVNPLKFFQNGRRVKVTQSWIDREEEDPACAQIQLVALNFLH